MFVENFGGQDDGMASGVCDDEGMRCVVRDLVMNIGVSMPRRRWVQDIVAAWEVTELLGLSLKRGS